MDEVEAISTIRTALLCIIPILAVLVIDFAWRHWNKK